MTDNPKTFDQAAVRTQHEIPCPELLAQMGLLMTGRHSLLSQVVDVTPVNVKTKFFKHVHQNFKAKD